MLLITSRSPSKYAVNGLNVEKAVWAWIRSVELEAGADAAAGPAASSAGPAAIARPSAAPTAARPSRPAETDARADGRPRPAIREIFMSGTPSAARPGRPG